MPGPQLTFTLMDETTARAILTWRYPASYAVYNIMGDGQESEEEAIAELLEPASPYYAVRDEQGELVGYFCFGTSALVWSRPVPGLYMDDATVPIGLGLRPDLTGHGLGMNFVLAGLDFARQAFTPKHFVLYVFPWNERAIRVYKHAGFQRGRIVLQKHENGDREFLEMIRNM